MIQRTCAYISRRINGLRVNKITRNSLRSSKPEAFLRGNSVRSGISPPLPKTRGQRDNICLTGTYLVPLEPRTLLTNS